MDIQNTEKVVNYNIEDELNPHFIGYTMIIESFKNNNLFYGISKSLYLARCPTTCNWPTDVSTSCGRPELGMA